MRTAYYGRSITDLVAFFFVFAAGSFALIAFPVHDFYSKVPTDHWVRAEHLSGALLFPAAFILYIAQTGLWRRRQRRLARQISDLVPESRATGLFPPEIQALVSSYDIECRLSGPLDTVDTDPTELLTAPQIVLPGVSRPILILPSRPRMPLHSNFACLTTLTLGTLGGVLRPPQCLREPSTCWPSRWRSSFGSWQWMAASDCRLNVIWSQHWGTSGVYISHIHGQPYY